MPVLGEIVRGQEIGKIPSQKYILSACEDCGKERWVQYVKGTPVNRLCARCSSIRNSKKSPILQKGDKHPNWRGGRKRDRYGYYQLHLPSHPRADSKGYVFEHIWVWEKTHNKPLPEGYVVHHLNGIKGDNRPRNLCALPKERHHSQLVNQALKQRIRELEIEVKLLEKALDTNQMIFRIEEN